jgi:hypothetical protein
MTIETLLKVLPPPDKPTYVFEGPWEVIETQLRTPLPQDYKDLVRLYGLGIFFGSVKLFHPAGQNIADSIVLNALDFQRANEDNPDAPTYPRPGGLLICGTTVNRDYICKDYICWLTRGATPEEWPIVVWNIGPFCDKEEFTVFEGDLTDFLAGIAERGGVFPGYAREEHPDGWLAEQQPFCPIPEPPYD